MIFYIILYHKMYYFVSYFILLYVYFILLYFITYCILCCDMLLLCLGSALPDINGFFFMSWQLFLTVSIWSVIVDTLAEKKKKEPKDIRNFDYTSRSWTGKSPKQFLIDWGRKNFPKSPPPSFEKVAVGRYWKCKYVALKCIWILIVYWMQIWVSGYVSFLSEFVFRGLMMFWRFVPLSWLKTACRPST